MERDNYYKTPPEVDTGLHQPDELTEQEAHAYRNIEHALQRAAQESGALDVDTARVIAATLHSGNGSALQVFASNGRVIAPDVLRELSDRTYDLLQVRWAAALITFINDGHPADEQHEQKHGGPSRRRAYTSSGHRVHHMSQLMERRNSHGNQPNTRDRLR
jgi:hypothetical protein